MGNFLHLSEQNLTYAEHFRLAMLMSSLSALASFKLFIHAIFPDVFMEDGSKLISDIYLNLLKPKEEIEPVSELELELEPETVLDNKWESMWRCFRCMRLPRTKRLL
jgi:hypothetical protein